MSLLVSHMNDGNVAGKETYAVIEDCLTVVERNKCCAVRWDDVADELLYCPVRNIQNAVSGV